MSRALDVNVVKWMERQAETQPDRQTYNPSVRHSQRGIDRNWQSHRDACRPGNGHREIIYLFAVYANSTMPLSFIKGAGLCHVRVTLVE